MTAWDVILENEHGDDDVIDTVFYDDNCDAWYVHNGLINHDGYDSRIRVQNQKTGEIYPEE
jgi:hypothetical protein